MRIHSRCAEGLERLRAYRFEWDEVKKVFTKKPLHNFASHTADGYRYVACEVQASFLAMQKPEETKKKPPIEAYGTGRRMVVEVNDEELFEAG